LTLPPARYTPCYVVHRNWLYLLIVASLAAPAVAVGCYNPSLTSPGFFCHVGDNPACPDGQTCVPKPTALSTTGRCEVKGGGGGGNVDMASNMGQDGGIHFLGDMAMMNTQHDFAMMTGGMTGCNGLITCINACSPTDMNCPTACQSNTTANGNALFNNLLNCILNACPANVPGDVCYNSSSAQCMQCFSDAQSPGPPQGACYNDLATCHNDLP